MDKLTKSFFREHGRRGGLKSRAALTPAQRRASASLAARIRWGHAPGHLREAFDEWVEAGADAKTVTVGYAEAVMPTAWLLGQLWNCRDIMPSTLCADLDMRQGSTYAMAVRRVKAEIDW